MGGKGKCGNTIPRRWDNYTDMGNIVPGTRFLPFKTPLKEEICKNRLPEQNCWFTPARVLQKAPNLKLVVDLTETDRYYNSEDFTENGVTYHKLGFRGGGRNLPPERIIHQFNRIIDSFLLSEAGLNQDALIGVHCTHGLNRTGYLICKYMVKKNAISAQDAIKVFECARGHKMERPLYISDILKSDSVTRRRHRIKKQNNRNGRHGLSGGSNNKYRRNRKNRCWRNTENSNDFHPYANPYENTHCHPNISDSGSYYNYYSH